MILLPTTAPQPPPPELQLERVDVTCAMTDDGGLVMTISGNGVAIPVFFAELAEAQAFFAKVTESLTLTAYGVKGGHA